jgi:hypothetical protein
MSKPESRGKTIGWIAESLGEPIHRVEYIIRSRQIQPDSVVGIIRVFGDEAVEQIASALREIDERRERGGA